MELESSIKYVLSNNRNDPLHFKPTSRLLPKTIDDPEKLILYILRKVKIACSYNSSNFLETSMGRLRSSLDIYRHCLFFNPSISLFDVMGILYKLADSGKISTHYCSTIKRRVFWINNVINQILDYSIYDEYGIKFSLWENLHGNSG